jgi:hypothetical protein
MNHKINELLKEFGNINLVLPALKRKWYDYRTKEGFVLATKP